MEWYYDGGDGEQAGPVSDDEIRGLITNGAVTADTKVWNERMEDWRRADSTDLRSAFAPRKTPPPLHATPDVDGTAAPCVPSDNGPKRYRALDIVLLVVSGMTFAGALILLIASGSLIAKLLLFALIFIGSFVVSRQEKRKSTKGLSLRMCSTALFIATGVMIAIFITAVVLESILFG